jgi:biotin carboxyl carrier protein
MARAQQTFEHGATDRYGLSVGSDDVAPGEEVAARQGLVVVEAMKMENELRAPAAGRVSEVRVTEGASVEANAVLVVLE